MNSDIFKCNFCDEILSYSYRFCNKCLISYSKKHYCFRMSSSFKISETLDSSKYSIWIYPHVILIDSLINQFSASADPVLQINFDLLPIQKFKSLDELCNLVERIITKHEKLYAYK